MSTITGEAAGNNDPITTQQMSTAQKARMRAHRVSGGRPNRGVGLFCARSMLRFNGCLFRLGDIPAGRRKRTSKPRPDVLRVRIG
jgi:hypothetical protein